MCGNPHGQSFPQEKKTWGLFKIEWGGVWSQYTGEAFANQKI